MAKIRKKPAAKGYTGPASVELFLPQYQPAGPQQLASATQRNTRLLLPRGTV